MDILVRSTWRHGAAPVLVAGLALTACASVDATLSSARISKAMRAVDEAKQSNATLNAPAEIRAAEDKPIEARAAVTKDDYAGAVRLAEQAVADAEYARARSDYERLRKMADEMRQNIQALREELQRMPQ